MGRVIGKVALVTGAAKGLGLAAAELLAEERATVVLTDIDAAAGHAETTRLAERGLAVSFEHHDVTDPAAWDRVMAETLRRHGKLDILVNNAGVAWVADVETETLEGWRRLNAVNSDAVFLGTQKAIAAMKGHCGSIINISSIEGIVGEPGLAAYNASKGAVRIFSKSAALHCARLGIRVNSVHPGYIDTPMVTKALGDLGPEIAKAAHDHIVNVRCPMGRLGRPREVAYGVLYLASDESSFVTGSELVIDGGYTAQ